MEITIDDGNKGQAARGQLTQANQKSESSRIPKELSILTGNTHLPGNSINNAPDVADKQFVEKTIADMKKRHGVVISFDVSTNCEPGGVCTPVPQSQQKNLLELVDSILSKYPHGFFERIGLHQITLSNNLRAPTKPVNSHTQATVGSVKTVPVSGASFRDKGTIIMGNAANRIGYTLDHEIAHIVSIGFDSAPNAIERGGDLMEYYMRHAGLSKSDFGNGSMQFLIDAEKGNLPKQREANSPSIYGHSDYFEHYAEIAARMFHDQTNLLIESQSSLPLRRAIEFVMQNYQEASGGKIDDKYWEDLRKGVLRDDNSKTYWDPRIKDNVDFVSLAKNGQLEEAAQKMKSLDSKCWDEATYKEIDQALNYFNPTEARRLFVEIIAPVAHAFIYTTHAQFSIRERYNERMRDLLVNGSYDQRRRLGRYLELGYQALKSNGGSLIDADFIYYKFRPYAEELQKSWTPYPLRRIAAAAFKQADLMDNALGCTPNAPPSEETFMCNDRVRYTSGM